MASCNVAVTQQGRRWNQRRSSVVFIMLVMIFLVTVASLVKWTDRNMMMMVPSNKSMHSHQRRRLQQQQQQQQDQPPPLSPPTSTQQQQEQPPQRPIIYTFFQHTENSGMTAMANHKLLEAWFYAWSQAGWQPVLLNMEQAKEHDRFAQFHGILSKIPFISEYDQLCFYRWLAMSQVGGGWMADMDVLPLHDFVEEGRVLPNDGRLTVYDRCVPSLVSGTAVEFQRMAFVILYRAQLRQHRHLSQAAAERRALAESATAATTPPSDHHWSDMLSLFDTYRKDESVFFRTFDVIKGNLVLDRVANPWPWTPEDCRSITHAKRAVHMSHLAAHSTGNQMDDRATILLNFWNMFQSSCLKETIHFTPGPKETGSSVWEC